MIKVLRRCCWAAGSRLPARSALLSLRLRGVHRTPAPPPGSKLPGPTRLRAIHAGVPPVSIRVIVRSAHSALVRKLCKPRPLLIVYTPYVSLRRHAGVPEVLTKHLSAGKKIDRGVSALRGHGNYTTFSATALSDWGSSDSSADTRNVNCVSVFAASVLTFSTNSANSSKLVPPILNVESTSTSVTS